MRATGPQASDETRDAIALLQRVAARDEAALSALYDQYARLLFGLVHRILRDRGEAEDVLQDVFLAVWNRAGSYEARLGPPAAWLIGIARNRAIDRFRSRAVRARVVEGADPPDLGDQPDNPEQAASRNERRERVRRALEPLPVEQRTLLEHAYFLGLTHSELAARFGLPLGTVKTRVRAAMLALRELLSGHE